MDGILFDTERISIECFFQAAKELGLIMPEHAVYGLLGLNAADGNAFFTAEMEKVYPGGTFPHEKFLQKHMEIRNGMLLQGPLLMKGVREILDFLQQKNIKLAVASSTARERVLANLACHDLTDYFEAIITGDMVEHSKPCPDIYQKACAALGVLCKEAAAVEDSSNGLRSAHAAGMFTVMVPDMQKPTQELEQISDLICQDLLELKDYLYGVLT